MDLFLEALERALADMDSIMRDMQAVDPQRKHSHRCGCGNKWTHSDACRGSVKDHTCDRCGDEVWHRV